MKRMKSNYATKRTLLVLVITGILTLSHFSPLFAAPSKGGAEPVAEGYPAWTGITPKHYIAGRVLLSNAELRQRLGTIVVEFDAAKTAEQLNEAGYIAPLNNVAPIYGFGSVNWAAVTIPHDVMVIFVARNVKDRKAVQEGLKVKNAAKEQGLSSINVNHAPVYEDVTFEGAPASGGKYPFVYMLGREGKEALVKETYKGKTTLTALTKAIAEQRKGLTEGEVELKWRPYYGYVDEPKFFKKDIETALAKGKPLDAVEEKLRKNVTSKDPARAKEAQMLYDALMQTKGDKVFLMQSAASESPHVAAYQLSQILKSWPKLKKEMKDTDAKINANPAMKPLIKMYPKIAQWSDPEFLCKNAAEAKKIMGELNKMKKQLEPMKEDANNIVVQNGALLLDGVLDELIATIPARVATK